MVGSQDIFEHAEDFDIHSFRLGAFKNCVGYALESAVHLGEREDPGGRGGRRSSRDHLGGEGARKKKNRGEKRKTG